MSSTEALFARTALLPSGWAQDVLLRWDMRGHLTEVSTQAACPPDVTAHSGVLLPGMPNLHSHAFQRGFAGLAEYRGTSDDDFWSWRERMYAFARRIGPEQLEAVATWLYIEMLEAGYTSVCEFHYVHLDRAGHAYTDDTTMSQALLRAAQTAGIGFTLLPVLYCQGGFDGRALGEAQRRFGRSVDELLRMIERLHPLCAAAGAGLGLAPHSLRAVPPDALREAVTGVRNLDAGAPIHIHIAEQTAEVDACVAWSGKRPVEWLLDQGLVDAHWCLVHATHMNYAETVALAASGAVAGICPSTEANLGDGIFPAEAYLAVGGHWGIGSDSHVSVSPVEELRLLEYAQRLSLRRRNVLASAAMPELPTRLYAEAVAGGCQASGHPTVGLEPGARADFVLLDAAHPLLAGFEGAQQLAAHLFAVPQGQAIRAVWSGGRACVEGGRHAAREAAAVAYAKARRQLFESP